ncbi:MAG: hypothetical protein M3304_04415 [Actinomycetota bacterium]|nr:hypothetical protein [Actinomycetota bacterium]
MVGVAILAAAGCRSSDEAPIRETSAAPLARATVRMEDVSVARRPATEAEVRWVATLATWSARIAGPVKTAAATAPTLTWGWTPRSAAAAKLRRALRRVTRCSESYERLVGEPPSERLADAAVLARDACESYEEGARAELEVLRDRHRSSLREWASYWATGAALLESVRDVFADYTPSNEQKLPRRSGVTEVSRIEPVFSRAAEKAIVRGAAPWAHSHSLQVRCWSRRDWGPLLRRTNALFHVTRLPPDTLGYQDLVGDYRINLSASVCKALTAFRYEHSRPEGMEKLELARALQTLAHEAEHARGIASEPVAECYGAQRVRRVAIALGADPAYADALAKAYWNNVYPVAPPPYRSWECRHGGALDLAPSSSAWP